MVSRDDTVVVEEKDPADRGDALERNAGTMLGHHLRTSGSELEHSLRASRRGPLQRSGMALSVCAETKSPGEDCGKDAPTVATAALSQPQTGHIVCSKKRTF